MAGGMGEICTCAGQISHTSRVDIESGFFVRNRTRVIILLIMAECGQAETPSTSWGKL